MTIEVWPSDLPQRVLAEGYGSGPVGNRLMTPMQDGSIKQRPIGGNIRQVGCLIKVDHNQQARFDRFWSEDVKRTKPFLFPAPQLDGEYLADESGVVLQDETGRPLIIEAWWLVQFGQQAPAYSAPTSRRYRIQFDLIVLRS
jgi:hypothetical protein